MSSDKESFEKHFPLPAGLKLRRRRFGSNPTSEFTSVVSKTEGAATATASVPLVMSWEDTKLGLTVLLGEQAGSGELVADVSCTDPAMLNKAVVSVALVGKSEPATGLLAEMIRKTIPLDRLDSRTGGCCGCASFGSVSHAIDLLGTELALVVFLEIESE